MDGWNIKSAETSAVLWSVYLYKEKDQDRSLHYTAYPPYEGILYSSMPTKGGQNAADRPLSQLRRL